MWKLVSEVQGGRITTRKVDGLYETVAHERPHDVRFHRVSHTEAEARNTHNMFVRRWLHLCKQIARGEL